MEEEKEREGKGGEAWGDVVKHDHLNKAIVSGSVAASVIND